MLKKFRLAICFLILIGQSEKRFDPKPVTLAFLGDIMLGRGVEQARCKVKHRPCAWDGTFADLRSILSSADLAIANLESPVVSWQTASVRRRKLDYGSFSESLSGYNLNASRESLKAVADNGIDFLSLANNHTYDFGLEGSAETQKAIKQYPIGTLRPQETPISIESRGLRFAFFALDDVTSPLDLPKIQKSVREASSAGQIVIISIHWGIEYQPGPNRRQLAIAQGLADAGARLIWGHHPHVLQRIAWISGNRHKDPTLVAYSLGNALFDQITPEDTRQSVVLKVQFSSQEVIHFWVIPFVINPYQGVASLAPPAISKIILHRLGMDPSNNQKENGASRPVYFH